MTEIYNSYNMEDITLKVRKLYLDGESYKNIQQELDIPANTWDSWVYKDYKDFRTNLQKFKHERLVRNSETVSSEILIMDTKDKEGDTKADLLRIKQSEAQFVRKTLGKDQGYSERTEMDVTSKGERIEGFNYLKPNDPNNNTNN